MALLIIHSELPTFSFAIKKNPASGMQFRKIRKGIGCGWFVNEQTYALYFKDIKQEVSFRHTRETVYDYLNLSQYCSPLAYLQLIQHFLSSGLREEEEKQVYNHQAKLNLVTLKRPYFVKSFQKAFPHIQINVDMQGEHHGNLEICMTSTLAEFLHFLQVFCVFFAQFSDDFFDDSKEALEKYVKALVAINAPYNIRHAFVVNFLQRMKMFQLFIPQLEEAPEGKIQYKFGSAHQNRRQFVAERINYDQTIVDIGCGEGYYVQYFAPRLELHDYYGIDIDTEVLNIVSRKAEKREWQNVELFSEYKDYLDNRENTSPKTVLLMEVLEHMPLNKSEELLQMVLEQAETQQIFISTPNRTFNSFYQLEKDEKRHPEHQWEMSQSELEEWLVSVITSKPFELEMLGIGDEINGIATTSGAILTRKDEKHVT